MVEALFTKVMSSQCKDKSLRTTHVGLMIFISLLSVGVSGIRTPSCCCLLKLLLEWAKIHFNRQFPGPWAVLRVEDWTKVLFSCRDRRAQQQDRRISFECARHRRAWGHSRPLLIWGCCEDCFFCCCYSTITGCFISKTLSVKVSWSWSIDYRRYSAPNLIKPFITKDFSKYNHNQRN